jgi:hypothetical protein
MQLIRSLRRKDPIKKTRCRPINFKIIGQEGELLGGKVVWNSSRHTRLFEFRDAEDRVKKEDTDSEVLVVDQLPNGRYWLVTRRCPPT